MIYNTGIDIVEIDRIKKIFFKYRDKFINRIINIDNETLPKEITCTFLASRFAAKEAFVKALGTGFRNNLNFNDIEILNDKLGKPYYSKSKKINNIIKKKFKIRNYDLFLSISDEKDYSVAFTILQKK